MFRIAHGVENLCFDCEEVTLCLIESFLGVQKLQPQVAQLFFVVLDLRVQVTLGLVGRLRPIPHRFHHLLEVFPETSGRQDLRLGLPLICVDPSFLPSPTGNRNDHRSGKVQHLHVVLHLGNVSRGCFFPP